MDFDKIEQIAPEYWRNSHLSIARFYGGFRTGKYYYIHDMETDYLVRSDIYKKKKAVQKQQNLSKKKLFKERQMNIFNQPIEKE